ncbi:OmpA family protein [Candidatus Nitrospira nitrificans]|uniref:OmpA-like domain-containing protein n=1 Tax=Candidatus Nitrospira nitrificans TaxID=1742973 RepID=A0A0S4LMH0_9BACT|nr:hypothetical protein [Candidatus Nitrospira nitrificans]CUS36290.1 exported hypothetical protein [Candidatus Nitrospira nitrificans]
MSKTFIALMILLLITAIFSSSYADPNWCQDEEREINNYPEYGTKLDEGQMTRLRNIAATIVRSQSSGSPILTVNVVGHADRALRVAPDQRAAKEETVSLQRAKDAKNQLVAILGTLPGGPGVISVIDTPIGAGAKNLKIQNPKNESEMRLNRRVVFMWSRCLTPKRQPDIPPRDPSDYPDDPNNVPAGTRFKMKILDGVGLSGAASGFSYYSFLFWDVDNHRIAEYTYTATITGKGIPPFSEAGESNWSEVFTISKPAQVDQLEGLGHHATGSIGAASGLTFGFNSRYGAAGSTAIFTGPSKSIGIEGGNGPLKVTRGTVQVYNGP